MDLDGNPTDVWTLEETWGIRERYIQNRGLRNYPDACAFNTDAGIVLPTQRKIYTTQMVQNLNEGIVRMVLGESPIPIDTALKAFKLRHKYNLVLGDYVLDFLNRVKAEYAEKAPRKLTPK